MNTATKSFSNKFSQVSNQNPLTDKCFYFDVVTENDVYNILKDLDVTNKIHW